MNTMNLELGLNLITRNKTESKVLAYIINWRGWRTEALHIIRHRLKLDVSVMWLQRMFRYYENLGYIHKKATKGMRGGTIQYSIDLENLQHGLKLAGCVLIDRDGEYFIHLLPPTDEFKVKDVRSLEVGSNPEVYNNIYR